MQPSNHRTDTLPGGRMRTVCARFFGRVLSVNTAVLLLLGSLVCVQPSTAIGQTHAPVSEAEVYHVLSATNQLSLTERFSRVLELEKRITRVDGFDPAVLTVSALTPHRIRIQAVSAGVTTLVLVDEFDKTYTIEVFVEGDVRYLQSYIDRFFPDSSVKAVKVKDSVVLRGVVADPSHISQITEVAEQFFPKVINHMQFGAANQVRLQVRIMEAQRSRIRQLGFNWSFLNGSGYVSSNPGSLSSPLGANLTPGQTPGLTYGGAGLSDSSISFGVVNANSVFRGFLEALKQEGLLRILVETSVVADSGRPASLLSGGEFPILVPQALGTLSVEWKEFGVKLEAVPIVLGQGQVILEIAPEFSERDFANAAQLDNTTVPAITTRRANTQVRMKFGQTLMIGGLIATRYTAETDKVPFLGELPGIGAAFRRVRYDENETELIILVTPEYVAPLDPHQVPDGGPGQFSDVPTDRELFWQGMIEVPNYGGPMPPNAGGYDEECMLPPMHGPGPVYTEELPPEMVPRQMAPQLVDPSSRPMPQQSGISLPPQPEIHSEKAPQPYGPPEVTPMTEEDAEAAMPLQTRPAPKASPAPEMKKAPSLTPAPLPAAPSLTPSSPQPPQPGETSSIPLLPVMPAPPSRNDNGGDSKAVTEAGHWQRSGTRVHLDTGRDSLSSNVTQTAGAKSTTELSLDEFANQPPTLIGPTPRKVKTDAALSAPMP